MIACNFRVIDESGPTGYYGFAAAQNKRELFWEIDQYVDPYQVEISTASSGSYCFLESGAGDGAESSNHETDGSCISLIEKWRKPNWPDTWKS